MKDSRKGPLAWFAANHVAANILMIFILVSGALALANIVVEVFPEKGRILVSAGRLPYIVRVRVLTRLSDLRKRDLIRVAGTVSREPGVKELVIRADYVKRIMRGKA